MSQQAEEYFSFLWKGLEGRALVALMDENGNPSNQRFFVWPAQKEQLLAYTAKQTARDTYTSPSLFNATNARKRSVKALRMVHADADTFNLEDARLEPSGIAHTSPGKTHVYWEITDCTDPALIEPLTHSVSQAHDKKTTGLDTAWASNKLLRVPGTTNTQYSDPNSKKYVKGAEPYEVTFETTGLTYTLAEFTAAYPPVEAVVDQFKEMGTLPTMGEALKSLQASPGLMQLLARKDSNNVDRSDALFLLEQELFRSGATDEAAYVICLTHAFNKFSADGKHNADELLWADILRARSKSELGELEPEDEYEAVITVEPSAKDKSVDFLTAQEKRDMPTTIIDDYIAWASSKTDAAPEYHVASAFMILSTVFSDFGHAVPKFGRLPLNLWFMVLGETTRSRKSTTRALGLKFIKELAVIPEADTDGLEVEYNYDLGSDFTPEALDNELLKRPNRSALLHRDEAQGWIQEMDKKAYMAGAKGKMTELYDGHVSGKLRATGDNNRRGSVDVSLTLFMMGIASQVADYLTQDDFRSGFLTRFIYIEATPPPRSAKSDYLEQANIHEVKQGDEVFTAMVKRIETSRNHWARFNEPSAPTIPVPCVPEAWERLNRFITDVLDAAEGHQRHQIIEAASDRLTKSILKAATLLAMLDCCDEVQLPHMLTAINFASSWFTHMVNMANRISESSWARRQAQVEEFLLEKGGTAKWEVVYRQFRSDLRADEFLKIIQALTDAGIIYVTPAEKGVRWITRIDLEEELAS